jgi:Undecaprenyl-phosphate glucose phosphotransferase
MTTTETTPRVPSVHDILARSDRKAYDRLSPWLTRRQFIDVSIAIDALLVFMAFIGAERLYTSIFPALLQTDGSYALAGLLAGLIFYTVTRTGNVRSELLALPAFWSVLRRLLITFTIVIVIGYGLKQAEIHSRLWLGLSFAFAFGAVWAKHHLVRHMIRNQTIRQILSEKIALFGDPAIASALQTSLQAELDHLCEFTIYNGRDRAAPAWGQLITNGLNNEINRIIFCLPAGHQHNLKELVSAIDYLPVQVQVCLAHAELQVLKSSLWVSRDHLLVSLDEGPLRDWGGLLKRIMDLTLGTLLLIAAAPIICGAAIAIKLETDGPVFFRQRRHGWNHSVIHVWKLRTMTVLEDGHTVTQAVQNDHRITRVGRILRKTSIDELPQLFNVLAGEMSLVGPRPHALAHNVHYSELIEGYPARHKVKPGITGWAQIKGFRGNSEDVSQMAARAEADIWYIQHWSLLLDLKIVLITPFVLLFQKNAF